VFKLTSKRHGAAAAAAVGAAAVAAAAGLEIVLSLGAAYGCYFVAEELAGASGLLAVVVMGFSMSLLGKAIC
jgi:NhaP-type Na+/H+ or K+/H+ antiporter